MGRQFLTSVLAATRRPTKGALCLVVGLALTMASAAGCGLNADSAATSDSAVDPATPDSADAETAPLEQAVEVERVPAAAGVGKKGRSLDQFDSGVQKAIAQPAKSFFATGEKMVFAVQIPQALQLFQATEGRMPRTHDEFTSRIIQPNNIRLPELPEGQQYEFDSETGELMVVRPAT